MFLFSRLMSRGPQVAATLIVFALASGVLGGVLFYMDSISPDVFSDMTEDVPVDLEVDFTYSFYNQNETTISDIEDIILDQDYIVTTEQVSSISTYNWEEDDYEWSRSTYLGVDSSFFGSFPDAMTLASGAGNLDDLTCYVEMNTRLHYGLAIGENFTIRVESYENGSYVELVKSFEIVGEFETSLFMDEYYWQEVDQTRLRIITTRNGLENAFGSMGHGAWDAIEDSIWVQFDKSAILGTDPYQAAENLDNVKRRIEQEALPFAAVSWDGFKLLDAVVEYMSWTLTMRLISIAFSIPSIIMGIMLVQYNSNLLEAEKRRDIGTLKTRGSSGWQSFNWVFGTAIVTGLIGSLGALLTGVLSAWVSGTVRTFLTFDLTQLSGFALLMNPEAILVVFVFSFTVGIIVALPSAIKALIMTPTEAHSAIETDVLKDDKDMGNPGIDLAAAVISGYLMAGMFVALSMIGFYWSSMLFFVVALVPFLAIFVISFTRLLSRPVASIKSRVIGRFKSGNHRVGMKLVSRTVAMFKRSEATGAVFIAMVFTAGIFSSISATTGYNHMVELQMFETGADMALTVKATSLNITTELLDNITRIEGVAHSAGVLDIETSVGYFSTTSPWGGRESINNTMHVIGIQPDKWIETMFLLPYFTMYNSPQVSISALSQSNVSVVSSFKPIDHYEAGGPYGMYIPVYSDDVTVYIDGYNGSWIQDCKIIDIMSANERYGPTYLPGEPNLNTFILININFLHEALNTTRINKIFVDLEEGADYNSVKAELWGLSPSSFESMDCALENIDESLDSRASQAIYGVYTLGVIYSLIYLTVGMTIVASVKVRKMRKQFSVLRAMGAEPKHLVAPVLLDTALGILLAAMIGGLVGLILTGLVLNLPLVFMGSGSRGWWVRLPILLAVPVPLILGIAALSFFFSLAATYIVAMRSLGANIAEEIQYTG